MQNSHSPENIDQYIVSQPQEKQLLLQQIRETVRNAVPDAVEIISYSMPAFKYKGKILCYFAAHKNHIGLYATPSANAAFEEELKAYETTKGTIRFPINSVIPAELIRKIVQYKMNEISVSTAKKK